MNSCIFVLSKLCLCVFASGSLLSQHCRLPLPVQCRRRTRCPQNVARYDSGLFPRPSPFESFLSERCACDKMCADYDDCCVEATKRERSPVDAFKQRISSNLRSTLACVNPSRNLGQESLFPEGWCEESQDRKYRASSLGWYLRSSCASNWPENSNWSRKIKQNCETSTRSAKLGDFLFARPVTAKWFSYQNVYCAMCNFERFAYLTNWTAQIICRQDGVEKEPSFNRTDIFATWFVHYFLPPKMKAKDNSVRRCRKSINTCLSHEELNLKLGYKISISNYSCLDYRCQENTDYVRGEINGKHLQSNANEQVYFKNQYCAFCNGLDLKDLSCLVEEMPSKRFGCSSSHLLVHTTCIFCKSFFDSFSEKTNLSAVVTNCNNVFRTSLSSIHSLVTDCVCLGILLMYLRLESVGSFTGVCIASCAVSLGSFLAVAAFGDKFTYSGPLCEAVGFFSHYFSLSLFAWSSIFGLNLVKAVATTAVQSAQIQQTTRCKSVIIFSLYGWGFPLLVCLICLTLDYRSEVNITYASDTICRLQPRAAELYAFDIPAGLMLIFDICCLFAIFIFQNRNFNSRLKINRNFRISRKLKVRKKASVFLGIPCMLGLVLGVADVATATEQLWLWYIFICAMLTEGIVLLFLSSFCRRKTVRSKGYPYTGSSSTKVFSRESAA